MAQTAVLRITSNNNTLDYVAGVNIAAGDVVEVGSVPLIATSAIASGALGSLAAEGVFDVPKTTATFTRGDAVYWNSTGTPVTGDASSGAAQETPGNLMGMATADAATGVSYVRVRLTSARRTTTLGGAVVANSLTGDASSLPITGRTGPEVTNVGAAVLVTGGTGNTTGNGGAVTITGGIPGVTSGTGGAATLTGGASAAGTNYTGGAAAVTGGAGKGTGNGGQGSLVGGAAGATGTGGAIVVTGGAAAGGVGGAITATGGAGGGANAGGAVAIAGGAGGAAGAGGAVSLTGGVPASGNAAGGNASLVSGAGSGTGNGGIVAITSGASGAGATGNGGAIAITGGAAASTDGNGGSITLTPGALAGTGYAGKIHLDGFVAGWTAQTIDMADDTVTLTRITLTGNYLLVDPNGNDENLLLPPEADMVDVLLIIKNTGGEHIALQNDAAGAIATIEDGECAFVHCNGTAWTVIQMVETA